MPSSPFKGNRNFGETCRVHLRLAQPQLATCFMLVSYLAYSYALKMEAACSSEMSVGFQLTKWQYIPEDRHLSEFCLLYFYL
jgi:hypothetical protein